MMGLAELLACSLANEMDKERERESVCVCVCVRACGWPHVLRMSIL